MLAGLGIAAVGGIALYVYSSSDTANEAGSALKSGAQSAKVAANFVPTKNDYQKVRVSALVSSLYPGVVNARMKVYSRIADIMEEASDKAYDGNQYPSSAYVSF